jgi:hypothetical protein
VTLVLKVPRPTMKAARLWQLDRLDDYFAIG